MSSWFLNGVFKHTVSTNRSSIFLKRRSALSVLIRSFKTPDVWALDVFQKSHQMLYSTVHLSLLFGTNNRLKRARFERISWGSGDKGYRSYFKQLNPMVTSNWNYFAVVRHRVASAHHVGKSRVWLYTNS